MQPTLRGPLLLLLSIALLVLPAASLHPAGASLPVIFFHGVGGNIESGRNFDTNLTADGRVYIPLSFCMDACSSTGLNNQVQLAIAQIRGVVNNDTRFDNGYVFMAHSQGGALARAVIEEMDDHKVKTFISLAAVANGVFHGPQPDDAVGVRGMVSAFASRIIPSTVFNTSKYSEEDLNGTFQYDISIFARDHPEAQEIAHFNHARSPVKNPWTSTNKFLAVYNNLNPCAGDSTCESEQKRRRDNYLKIEAAHYFASPSDGVVTPWQSSILGQYNEIESYDEFKTQFSSMHVIDMKDTTEYQEDTYGLKTLDGRGGLFRYVLPNVTHSCWARNSGECIFQDVYDNHIYPILAST